MLLDQVLSSPLGLDVARTDVGDHAVGVDEDAGREGRG